MRRLRLSCRTISHVLEKAVDLLSTRPGDAGNRGRGSDPAPLSGGFRSDRCKTPHRFVTQGAKGPFAIFGTLLLWVAAATASTIDEDKVVDLTHTFNAATIYWPTEEGFRLEKEQAGVTPGGWYYAANRFRTAEHGGTHLDAPIHFAAGKDTVDEVPLSSLIGPLVVLDVSAAAAADPDYRVTVTDIEKWEAKHGRLPRGAIVVMRSGWSARWPDRAKVLGTATPGDTENLHFPGFSKEAATFLVEEREVDAIGVDTPSLDHGPSRDFIVHQIINGANKPGLENLAGLETIPASGATIIALPMKVGGGSGAPTRVIAVLP